MTLSEIKETVKTHGFRRKPTLIFTSVFTFSFLLFSGMISYDVRLNATFLNIFIRVFVGLNTLAVIMYVFVKILPYVFNKIMQSLDKQTTNHTRTLLFFFFFPKQYQ